jgi:hypothetical protein
MNSPKEDTNTVTSTTDKMQLRFIFANRDGVSVEIECSPTDTVETMKSALISEWPKGKYQIIYYHDQTPISTYNLHLQIIILRFRT